MPLLHVMDIRGSTGAAFSELAALRARSAAAEAECARLTATLERRSAELERSRARFQDVIEQNPDAIVVVDRDGVIRFVNARAAELFATPREVLQGTPFGFPMVAGETTELDLVRAGRSVVVEMRVVETEWEHEPACIASLRDITERKQAEEAARRLLREQVARTAAEAEARRLRFLAEAGTLLSLPLDYAETLRTLARLCVDNMADWAIIYTVAEDGAVQRLEVAHHDPALAEVTRAMRELPIPPGGTNPVLDVLRTRSPLLLTDIDDARLAELTEDRAHLELVRRLGVSSLMIVPLVARGRELGAIGLISAQPERPFTPEDLNVASELAARAALAVDNVRLFRMAQEANEAKSKLLAVISHDLRTPLNSIMGHVELLMMGIPDQLSEGALQRAERIRLSAAHLVYLIDELLSFARLDGGHEAVRLQEIDACGLTDEVIAVMEPLARSAGLEFRAATPPEPVLLNSDPDRLRQILLNLVGNAVKYTEQGEVRLSVTAGSEHVEWLVEDTGIGIAADHITQIFEPFWQVDPGQRSREGGTGLGLSVVRRLVGMLNGTVEVRSEPGRGSAFAVRFPRAAPVEPDAA